MLRPNPSPMNMMVKGKGRGTTPKSSIININIITKLVNYWKTPLEQVELTTTWHFFRKPVLVIPGYVSVFELVKECRNGFKWSQNTRRVSTRRWCAKKFASASLLGEAVHPAIGLMKIGVEGHAEYLKKEPRDTLNMTQLYAIVSNLCAAGPLWLVEVAAFKSTSTGFPSQLPNGEGQTYIQPELVTKCYKFNQEIAQCTLFSWNIF